jgi:peptide/nickel transport system substrate-binding protein
VTYRLLLSCLTAIILATLPVQAETIRWGRSGDAVTLDPHAATDAMTMQLVRNIYEPLVAIEPDGSLSGKLASSWLQSADDPNVWLFNLRSAVFHDDAKFDADDVVFSFDRARADGSALKDRTSAIISVRALDPSSVEIRFANPSPIMPAVISDIMVMDKEWAEANGVARVQVSGNGEQPFSQEHANGTGPYRLEARDPDVRTALAANDRYNGSSLPVAEQIIYLPIANPAMQANALMWGEIDVLQDVAFADMERLAETDGITVETGPANSVLYLGYRLDKPEAGAAENAAKNPLADPKVREAIDRAISRSELAGFTGRGFAEPTAILAPSFVNGWSRGLSAELSPDRTRARELLAEAGYTDGFAVKLDAADREEAVANRIAATLASLGIWADVVTRPGVAHEAHIASGESAFYLADYAAPGYDSAAILEWLIDGREGYENAALAARVEALSGITNRSERNAAIARLWLDVQGERIVLPIAQRKLAHAMRDGISLPVDPNNQTRFDAIRFRD